MVEASTSEINSAKDLILSIAAETGKDYSTLISRLEESELETIKDL